MSIVPLAPSIPQDLNSKEKLAPLRQPLSIETAKKEIASRININLTSNNKIDKTAFQPQPYQGLENCVETELKFATPSFIKKLSEEKEVKKAGLLPEIDYAYYLIGGKCYLWNISENVYHVLECAGYLIDAVNLVRPCPGMFPVSVKHILVVGCHKLVRIFGVSKNGDGTFDLHQFEIEAKCDWGNITCISGATGGRIFLGTVKGDILEFIYPSSTPNKNCYLRNCVQSYFARFTNALGFASTDGSIVSLVVDNERKTLYSLDDSSKIKIINLGANGDEFGFIGESCPPYHLTHTQVPITSLVNIHVIPHSNSVPARLVAVSPSGACIYFKSAKTSGPDYATSLNTSWFQPSVYESPNVLNNTSVFSRDISLLASGNENNTTNVTLHFSEGAPKISLSRSIDQYKTWTIDGRVYDAALQISSNNLTFVPSDMVPFLLSHDDLKSQYYCPPRAINFLSSSGIIKITKLRPIDQLLKIFKSNDNPGLQFKSFIERFGENETCAMALAILSKYPLAWTHFNTNITNIYRSANSINTDDILVERFYNMFKEIGGHPHFGTIPTTSLVTGGVSRPSSIITYSNYVSGALIFVSRIMAPVWSCRLFWARTNLDNSLDYEFAISQNSFSYVKRSIDNLILALNQIPVFAKNLPSFIEKEVSISASEGTSSALQIEQRIVLQFKALLELCSQCISFILVLQQSKIADHISTLETTAQEKIKSLKLEVLLAPDVRDGISVDLTILALMHQPKEITKTNSITSILRSSCQTYLNSNAISFCEALEIMNRSRTEYNLKEKAKLLDQSLVLLLKSRAFMTIGRLGDIVISLLEFSKEKDALLLIAQCSDIFGFSKTLDFSSPSFHAYQEFIGIALGSLLAKCKKSNGSGPEDFSLLVVIVKQSLKTVELEYFHNTVYKWFLHHNLFSQLYELNTTRLEAFLSQCTSIEESERLFSFYEQNRDYIQAAKVYLSLATSSRINLRLECRIAYLQKALEISERGLLNGAQDRYELKDEIHKLLKTSNIQKFALEEYAQQCSKNLDPDLVSHVNNKLLTLSELTLKLISPNNLHVSHLLVLHHHPSSNWAILNSTWKGIIDSVKEKLILSQAYHLLPTSLRTKLIEVSKKIPCSSPAFPLTELCGMLINLHTQEPELISPEWILKSLQEYGASTSEIVLSLESLLVRKFYPFNSDTFMKNTFCVLAQALKSLHSENPNQVKPRRLQSKLRSYRETCPSLQDDIEAFASEFNLRYPLTS